MARPAPTAPTTPAAAGVALVLLHDRPAGLWSNAVRALLDAVSERLPGVYVTAASADGHGPGLADALAASRYAGCAAAVVVAVHATAASKRAPIAAQRPMATVVTVSSWEPEEVVRAYQRARAVAAPLPATKAG